LEDKLTVKSEAAGGVIAPAWVIDVPDLPTVKVDTLVPFALIVTDICSPIQVITCLEIL
jgi:hypothetical protein